MSEVLEKVRVGIADLDVVRAPKSIITSGLGSCVGLILYDEMEKVAGLVHVMLPDSSLSRAEHFKPGKYADTGIETLINKLIDDGAKKYRLKAKMAGGAQMFQTKSDNEMLRIGARNIEAVKTILNDLKIPIIASDVGGNKGRTIEFNAETYQLKIKTIHEGIKYL